MQAMTTTAFVHGFSSTAMLIMAIGAQNAFVLRQGLRREHVLPVVALCALSDAVLLQAGVWGMGGVRGWAGQSSRASRSRTVLARLTVIQ